MEAYFLSAQIELLVERIRIVRGAYGMPESARKSEFVMLEMSLTERMKEFNEEVDKEMECAMILEDHVTYRELERLRNSIYNYVEVEENKNDACRKEMGFVFA